MRVNKIGVHRTHCCIMHGCKYGDEDCPVLIGVVLQDHLCEDCDDHVFNFYGKNEITRETIKQKFIVKNRKFKLRKLDGIKN